MFENLIESKPKAKKSIGQTFVSLLVHAAVIFAAVKVTTGAAETIKDIVADTTMVFLKPPPPPPPPPDQPPPDVVVAQNPPPKGFQTVVAPTDIPKDIPPIDLNEKPFDPKDFTGKGIEGGIAAGIVGGTGPVPPTIPDAMPPSTPFPVKSFGSKGFSSRSMGGMSLGMSVGATTVWNPFGGGLAATTTSGGG